MHLLVLVSTRQHSTLGGREVGSSNGLETTARELEPFLPEIRHVM